MYQRFNRIGLASAGARGCAARETVSQFRSWFESLTTNGIVSLQIKWFPVRPEVLEGRTSDCDTGSERGGFMGEILGLGITHYPGLTVQGNLCLRIKMCLADPALPERLRSLE